MSKPVIAITTGEPAGIGPEIAIRGAFRCLDTVTPVLIGDRALLEKTAAGIHSGIRLKLLAQSDDYANALSDTSGTIGVIDSPLATPAVAGRLDPRNGPAVLSFMDIAISGAMHGQFDAVVTGPVQKSTINEAGIPFTGHTEYFAEKTGTRRVVMMLAGRTGPYAGDNRFMLRVALATTHLPLKDVSKAISYDSLLEIVRIIHNDLKKRFGLEAPHILAAGLNPHAGESGYLGDEEIRTIIPAIDTLRTEGIRISGPYPADTLFQPHYLADADCILSMYHDQGLPVLKYATFGHGVNITLGLPIIRTSVDHGTALDIAARGLGIAQDGSMIEAIRIAAEMASFSRKTGQCT